MKLVILCALCNRPALWEPYRAGDKLLIWAWCHGERVKVAWEGETEVRAFEKPANELTLAG